MKNFGIVFFICFLLALFAATVLVGCGADWATCETCTPEEKSAQADDGAQIPVVVVVNVDVDVNQNQVQIQGQGQTNTFPLTPPVTTPADAGLVVDAGTRDAGRPDSGVPDAGHDAGVRDAGMPDAGVRDAGVKDAGVPDAGCRDAGVRDAGTCRRVCTCTEHHFVCSSGLDTTRRADCTCGIQREYDKCLREVIQCS